MSLSILSSFVVGNRTPTKCRQKSYIFMYVVAVAEFISYNFNTSLFKEFCINISGPKLEIFSFKAQNELNDVVIFCTYTIICQTRHCCSVTRTLFQVCEVPGLSHGLSFLSVYHSDRMKSLMTDHFLQALQIVSHFCIGSLTAGDAKQFC